MGTKASDTVKNGDQTARQEGSEGQAPPPSYSSVAAAPPPSSSAQAGSSAAFSNTAQKATNADQAQAQARPAPNSSGPSNINAYYPAANPAGVPATTYVPYYDARSPYSLERRRAHARTRFLGALLWAIAITFIISFISGGVAYREVQRHKHRWGHNHSQ